MTGAEAGWTLAGDFESSERAGEHLLQISVSEPMKVHFTLETGDPEARP